jgi:hypothetical protein
LFGHIALIAEIGNATSPDAYDAHVTAMGEKQIPMSLWHLLLDNLFTLSTYHDLKDVIHFQTEHADDQVEKRSALIALVTTLDNEERAEIAELVRQGNDGETPEWVSGFIRPTTLHSIRVVAPSGSSERTGRKKPYINRCLKNESSAVCFSRWAQGNRQNHTVGSRYESTEGRQQKGDPTLREKKRSLQG